MTDDTLASLGGRPGGAVCAPELRWEQADGVCNPDHIHVWLPELSPAIPPSQSLAQNPGLKLCVSGPWAEIPTEHREHRLEVRSRRASQKRTDPRRTIKSEAPGEGEERETIPEKLCVSIRPILSVSQFPHPRVVILIHPKVDRGLSSSNFFSKEGQVDIIFPAFFQSLRVSFC